MKEKRELLLAKLVLQEVDCSVMEDQNTKLVLQYCYNLILFRVGCSAIVGGVSKASECWMGYKLCVIFAMKHPYSTINTIKPFDMRPIPSHCFLDDTPFPIHSNRLPINLKPL